jgi:hypothetical protein
MSEVDGVGEADAVVGGGARQEGEDALGWAGGQRDGKTGWFGIGFLSNPAPIEPDLGRAMEEAKRQDAALREGAPGREDRRGTRANVPAARPAGCPE